MFKFVVVLAMVVCYVNAGVIGLGGLGHGAVVAAPVAVAHAAQSYANSNSISLHPTPVVATVAHAAPIAVAHAAPVAVVGHGIGLGGIGLGGLGHGGLLH